MIADRLIKSVFGRRGLSNPSLPLTAKNISSFFGDGMKSRAGVPVTEDTTLSVPALTNGIRILTESIMKLPLVVYRMDADGGKEKDRMHPAYPLLADGPNGSMPIDIFIQVLTANALMHGNGYAYIQRRTQGTPVAMYWLDPMNTTPYVKTTVDIRGRIVNRTIGYSAWVGDGHRRRYMDFSANNIFHLRGLSCNDAGGKKLIEVLADSIGAAIGKTRYTSVFFKNNAAPSVVVKVPWQFDDADDLERFRQSFRDVHAGTENAHRIAVLEGNADISPFSFSARDSQLIESMQLSLVDAANIFGIPATFLNADVSTSYNSLEQKYRDFMNMSLGGWLHKWMSEARRKLLTFEQREQGSHSIEFIRDELERADRKTEAEVASIHVNSGLRRLNEVRRQWNMPAVEGGDRLRVPLNLGVFDEDGNIVNPNMSEPATDLNEPPQEEPGPDETVDMDDDSQRDDVYRRRLFEKMLHSLEKCTSRVSIQSKKATRDAREFQVWVDSLEEKQGPIFANELAPLIGEAEAHQWARSALSQLADQLIELSGNITEPQLDSAVGQFIRAWQMDKPVQWRHELMKGLDDG